MVLRLGIETGMGPTRINTILQSAFFKLANIIPEERAIELMKAAAKATYGRKGEDVVKKNWAAIDAGAQERCRDSGSGKLEERRGRGT